MLPKIPEIKNPERFLGAELSREKLEYALGEAIKKIDYAMTTFGKDFAEHASVNNVYPTVDNSEGWNQGFWSGMLWHAYELTGDEKYRKLATEHVSSFLYRIENKIGVNHHDMGFLYTPSCVAAYKLTGNETAKRAALLAADNLIGRWKEKGEFIQAWGNLDDPNSYRLIVDCLLNVPLLHWASEVTGDPKYTDIGYRHFRTTISVCCRPDASTYHTYYFNPETGEPARGVTNQGASDDSAWARGQTWGIYGPMLTYIYKKDPDGLELFKATTNYYLNYLPHDYVAFWDLSYTDGDDEPRDTSSTAIAVCGMLEGLKHMGKDDPLCEIYRGAVNRLMASLIDNYLTKDIPEANGLLLHATYGKPQNNGVDEMNIWGDYFYMEALHRLLNPDWRLYW